MVNITQIQLSDTEVIIDWRITGEDQVSYIEITIHRVTSSSPGEVELYEIYSLTVNNTSTIAQCFNGLNDSDIYQFCVVAVSRDGTRYATCEIRTTTTSDTGLRNTGDCQRVTSQSPVEEGVCVCMYVCIYICMYVCIYVCVSEFLISFEAWAKLVCHVSLLKTLTCVYVCVFDIPIYIHISLSSNSKLGYYCNSGCICCSSIFNIWWVWSLFWSKT